MPQIPTPFASKGEVDRLGERLRQGGSEADFQQLTRWREAHVAPLEEATTLLSERLCAAGGAHQVSKRVKTVQTILDKLRRERQMELSSMQDIAGIRIVVSGSRSVQDEFVSIVTGVFPQFRVKDRREKPSYGYRAVHVIVKHQGMSIEVQVRTKPQQVFAESMEKLGDKWGRQIRYGGLPDDADHVVGPGTRKSVVDLSQQFALAVDRAEQVDQDREKYLEKLEKDERRILRSLNPDQAGGLEADARVELERRLAETRAWKKDALAQHWELRTTLDALISQWRILIDLLD